MSTDSFAASRAGNRYVLVTHNDGHEYDCWSPDDRRIEEVWTTPAGAFLPHLDPEQSLMEAEKHIPAARAVAEEFLRQELE